MRLLQRIARICKADIHGLVDQFENKELLLKQYLRDMSAALMQKEGLQKRLSQSRHAAAQKFEMTHREIEKLELDLERAIKQDKDGIARNLIRRLRPTLALRAQIQKHIDDLDREMAQRQATIDQQRLQFEQLKQRTADFIDRFQPDRLNPAISDYVSVPLPMTISDEDIEAELRHRKETLSHKQGGATS